MSDLIKEMDAYAKFDPYLANKLPNGAVILGREQVKDRWVWLAYWNGHGLPYVTWESSVETPGHTYWGNYFESAQTAFENFSQRAGKYVATIL